MQHIPETIGRYSIRSVLAQTPTITVYEAWDDRISRRVALKVLRRDRTDDTSTDALLRFLLSARSAGRLIHPNIVTVYDFAEEDDLAYLVMEFVEGMTLRAALRSGAMSISQALHVMRDILEGLSYSHMAGIVHRDIKPSNIILTKAGDAKLTDFGIVRPDRLLHTRRGILIGTPEYMAPEQILNATVDAQTDIYAAGVVFYEMLTGRTPFRGNPADVLDAVVNGTALPPSLVMPSVPATFDLIIKQAMEKRREFRFASAREFYASLKRFALLDKTILKHPEPVQRTWTVREEPTRSKQVPMLIGSAIAVLALTGAFAVINVVDGFHFGRDFAPIPVARVIPAPAQVPIPVRVATLPDNHSVEAKPIAAPKPTTPLFQPDNVTLLTPPPVAEPHVETIVSQDAAVQTVLDRLRRHPVQVVPVKTAKPSVPKTIDEKVISLDKCWTAGGSPIGITYSCTQDSGNLVRLVVIGVTVGGPADLAGIRSGDVIVGLDGHSGRDPLSLELLERRMQTLDVMRGERIFHLHIH